MPKTPPLARIRCMNWICRLLCPAFAVVLFATHATAQPVSLDEVRVDFGKGDYRAALTKTNRLFSASNQEPMPADKFEMLMLRGECQLQLKDRLGAMTSFKSAAKCAA